MCDNYKKITNCCTLILRGNDLFDFEAFVFIRSIIFGRIYIVKFQSIRNNSRNSTVLHQLIKEFSFIAFAIPL